MSLVQGVHRSCLCQTIFKISAPVWDHFFECLGLFLCIGFGSEVICMMSAYENGLHKVYGQDGFSLL